MFTLFWQYIKDRKISLLAYTGAEILFVAMYVSLFPAIQQQAEKLQEIMQTYPKGVFEAFQIQDLSFTTLEKFLQVEQYSITWPILAVVLAVGLAAGALSREIEQGTMENILAKPVSRLQVYFSRYASSLAIILIFAAVSVFSVFPVAWLAHISFEPKAFALMFVAGFAFAWAVLSIAFMFSALFSDRGKTLALSGGIIFVMYVLNVVATLKEGLKNLKYISLFHYYDFVNALTAMKLSAHSLEALLGIILVTTALGAVVFQRRDITK